MFAKFVTKVAYTCPQCNTSITFSDIDDDIREFFHATEHLTCPKCSESLSSDARSMAHAIYEYNKAAQELNNLEKDTNSELF